MECIAVHDLFTFGSLHLIMKAVIIVTSLVIPACGMAHSGYVLVVLAYQLLLVDILYSIIFIQYVYHLDCTKSVATGYIKNKDGDDLFVINNCSVLIIGTGGCCDIQQYFVYGAVNGSATLVGSVLDPFVEYILNNTIVDTHFVARLRPHSNIRSVERHINITVIGINE